MPERGVFTTIGRQLGLPFAHIGAVDAENLVVGAGYRGVARLIVGLVALPEARCAASRMIARICRSLRHRHIDAAALTVDPATETDFTAGIFGNDVTAKPLESRLPI